MEIELTFHKSLNNIIFIRNETVSLPIQDVKHVFHPVLTLSSFMSPFSLPSSSSSSSIMQADYSKWNWSDFGFIAS